MDKEQNLDRKIVLAMQKSPLYFIRVIWGILPQPIKEEYKNEVDGYVKLGQWDEVKHWHFDKFVKGKHITWQQWLVVMAVERALVTGDNKISVVAGHGVGKSSVLAMILLWHLFCHLDAQVGATAPTTEQLHDVLWKEVKLWMDRMPKELSDLFEWQTGYVRVKERPETWFARARTARKEAPEAIAGLHGDHVLIIGDESSGIAEEIFRSAEGSMTGPNVLVILIGNGTRPEGYFYDTHIDPKEKERWQRFSFSSEESPIVEEGFVERIESKWGRNSDEFKIRVSGGFPSSDSMDTVGWIPLVTAEQVNVIDYGSRWTGRKVMAVDPTGEGDDTSVWLIRDNFHARVVESRTSSNEKDIAMKTLELMKEFEIAPTDVIIDNFGVGANVAREMVLLDGGANVTAMNWGENADDEDVYLNKRAQCCFRAREWLLRGGSVAGEELKKEILAFQYINTLKGKKKILDKPKIRQKLTRSPDRADAFFMSFYHSADLQDYTRRNRSDKSVNNDKYSAI